MYKDKILLSKIFLIINLLIKNTIHPHNLNKTAFNILKFLDNWVANKNYIDKIRYNYVLVAFLLILFLY